MITGSYHLGGVMDLLKLKYFHTVAKLEHVTKAAEELHVAQPAITKTVKFLEDDLGVPLFKRVGRNVKLTEFGELLKKRLDLVFATIDSVTIELETMKKQNKFTVKLNVLAASIAVMDAVIAYKNDNPEVIFNLIQNQEKTDCNVFVTTVYGGETTTSSNNKKVIKERIFLAVPFNSEYALKKSIKLIEVKDEKFINIAGSRPFRMICDKMCEKAGFKPTIGFESDSPIAVQNIIAAEAGIGFWPEFSWRDFDKSKIALIPIEDEGCERDIIVELVDDRSNSEYAEHFFKFLTAYLIEKQSNK